MSATGDPPPRVRTAYSDPVHTRLVYDLEERLNEKRADRGKDPDDPWAVQPGDDCGILPAGEGEPEVPA